MTFSTLTLIEKTVSSMNLSEQQITAIDILYTVLDVDLQEAIREISNINKYRNFVFTKSVYLILDECNLFNVEAVIHSYNVNAHVARDIESQELLFRL